MMMKWQYVYTLFLLSSIISCRQEAKKNVKVTFTSLHESTSGIHFSNRIIENDTLNYFKFPYMYMGGGVSIGDINNDGLPDIYFTGNMSSNKLYLNKGNMQFEDITDAAGVGGDNRWYTGSTMADVNNDGWLDIYVCVSGKYTTTKNQLFINNQDNTFTEKAGMYGIDDASPSIQATFFDYDKDGFLDLFVGNYPLVPVSKGNTYYHNKMITNNYSDAAHLYRNNGDQTYSDVTKKAGVHHFGLTLGIVATDFNNDGWEDLYISNDFNVPDYCYLNNKDGTFKEIIKEATGHTSMFGMGTDAADFNNDNLIDIIQVDMTPEDHKRSKTNMASMRPESFYEAVALGLHYQYMQNSLQLNNGTNENGIPRFSDISRFAGLATTDWSWGALFADFNNDGWKDIMITNGMKRDVNNNDTNHQNNTKSFFGDTEKFDYKLFPSTPIDNYIFKNNGDFTFSKVNEAWKLSYKGFSNGFSYGDLDNDGDLDIVVNNLDDVASVFKNETEKTSHHYLRIKLIGPETNPFGLGSKLTVHTSSGKQLQELTLSRGFQSSVEPTLHFGLGKDEYVDELQITWPDGRKKTLKNIPADQLIAIKYQDTKPKVAHAFEKSSQIFQDITEKSGIDFLHQEDTYNDFTHEPLLPHKNSRFGPALAVGDINNDGLDDFFAGNAAGSAAAMYIQTPSGTFKRKNGPWEQDYSYEDTGALLFDADHDGDLDLYVVNGGNDPTKDKTYYQDRIYLNTENGYIRGDGILPEIHTSGQVVSAADYDHDGDLDLFIGGRIVPGQYPFPARSYILRNDGGKDHNLHYSDVTKAQAPELHTAGLVTSVLWDDFDHDHDLDLIIAGEWMPIRFFRNVENNFKEVTDELGFKDSTGWWYSLKKADMDGDGDMDYLAGNLGLNYKYKANKNTPFEIYASDFDENNHLDIVLSFQEHGIKVPLRGRECSSQQIPAIKKRFKTFEAFATASLSDIYGEKMLAQALRYSAKTFAHYWIENQGGGEFTMHPLPSRTQFSSINAFEVFNHNQDKHPSILMGGNLYGSEVETPRNDAGMALLLSGNSLHAIAPHKSRLFITGEIRDIAKIHLAGVHSSGFLFALNDDRLKLVVMKNTP